MSHIVTRSRAANEITDDSKIRALDSSLTKSSRNARPKEANNGDVRRIMVPRPEKRQRVYDDSMTHAFKAPKRENVASRIEDDGKEEMKKGLKPRDSGARLESLYKKSFDQETIFDLPTGGPRFESFDQSQRMLQRSILKGFLDEITEACEIEIQDDQLVVIFSDDEFDSVPNKEDQRCAREGCQQSDCPFVFQNCKLEGCVLYQGSSFSKFVEHLSLQPDTLLIKGKNDKFSLVEEHRKADINVVRKDNAS